MERHQLESDTLTPPAHKDTICPLKGVLLSPISVRLKFRGGKAVAVPNNRSSGPLVRRDMLRFARVLEPGGASLNLTLSGSHKDLRCELDRGEKASLGSRRKVHPVNKHPNLCMKSTSIVKMDLIRLSRLMPLLLVPL